MSIDLLKTFLTVVDMGSFTEAAKYLYITQSTVSNRIRKLEQKTGKTLFVRFYDHVELTVYGKTLVPYAEKIVMLETEAIEKVRAKDNYFERLIVGSVYFFYECYLTIFLQDYVLNFPKIALKIVLKHSNDIIKGVVNGIYDIGYTHHPYDNPDYCCKLINKDEIVLVTNSQNRKYEHGIYTKDIKKIPIFYSSFLYSKTSDWLFGKHHLFQLDIDIGHKIIPFINDGDRYTFLPRKLIGHHLNEGTIIEIPFLDFNIPPLKSYVIYNKRNSKKTSIDNWLKMKIS